MFIGHFAVAMAAKRAVPQTSLGWLFAACQLPDLLWPAFLLTGIERARIAPGDTAFTPLAFEHYPWSHSLLMVAIWAVVLGGAYRFRRNDGRAPLIIATLVVSHWILDWVTHRPDLPLVPGGEPKLGLGLWNHPTATLLIEAAMFAVGVWIYSRSTKPRDRTGRWAWVALVAFLVVMHSTNAFSPPPPDMTAVAIAGLAIWLLVWWGAWVDRHRVSTS
jgi:membrane-bound metal-dependent hydrolase YbcI (DUF457 family)